MAGLTSGTVGFITSTAVIVVFGEILPQAWCSRYALQVGSKAVPLVRVIICLMYVLAAPLAFALDKLLGRELATTYSKSEMIKLLQIHVEKGMFDQETGVAMTGALKYKDLLVKNVMTTLEHVFMLNADEKLSFDVIAKIFKAGYSRIPVYEVSKNNIIGLLFAKDLIFVDPADEISVKNLVQIFGRGKGNSTLHHAQELINLLYCHIHIYILNCMLGIINYTIRLQECTWYGQMTP